MLGVPGAGPELHRVVSRVRGVGECAQHFLIPAGTAAVVEGTGPLSLDTTGHTVGLAGPQVLQDQVMFPSVAKVVAIEDAVAHIVGQLVERDPLLVDGLVALLGVRLSKTHRSDRELMEVPAGPVKGVLEGGVDTGQRQVVGENQSAPDRGLDVAELDVDLVLAKAGLATAKELLGGIHGTKVPPPAAQPVV